MLITFSSLVPRYRIERLLDPTTSYLCLSNKPKQPCSPHPSKPLFGHVPCLLNHWLLCMLRMLSTVYPVTPWIGLSHYYIIVDDVIYYNVDYTRQRMEGLGYPAPTLCSIRVT